MRKISKAMLVASVTTLTLTLAGCGKSDEEAVADVAEIRAASEADAAVEATAAEAAADASEETAAAEPAEKVAE